MLLKITIVGSVSLLLLGPSANANETIGRLFSPGSTSGKPLFTQDTTIQDGPSGHQEQTSTITALDGKVSMTEHTEYVGYQLIKQEVQQLQSREAYELEVHGNDVTFRTYTIENGTRKLIKTVTEAVDGTLLSGPVTNPYIEANWDKIVKGEQLKVRFAVMELSRTIGFTFEKKSSNDKELVVEMRISSFLLSLLYDHPLELTFDAQSHHLIGFSGRTPLRIDVGNTSKPFDSEIVYQEIEKHDEIAARIREPASATSELTPKGSLSP